MKKHVASLFIIVLVIAACQKNNEPNILMQQNYYVNNIYRDFDSTEIFYTSGKVNKKIFRDKYVSDKNITVDYYYHAEQLDSTVHYSATFNYQKTFIFTYNSKNLIRIHSNDKDSTNYIFKYDSGNQVTEQSFSGYIYGNHGEVVYSEYLFKFRFISGNIVKCEEFFRASPESDYSATDTITYTYDNEKNPFSIFIDPAVSYFPFSGKNFCYWNKNNIVKEEHTAGYPNSEYSEYVYNYNSSGYPVSVLKKYNNGWGHLTTSNTKYTYICE